MRASCMNFYPEEPPVIYGTVLLRRANSAKKVLVSRVFSLDSIALATVERARDPYCRNSYSFDSFGYIGIFENKGYIGMSTSRYGVNWIFPFFLPLNMRA